MQLPVYVFDNLASTWYTPKFGYRLNAVFTIFSFLSSEKQRKTAAEQRTFCCFLGRPIARGPGFLRNSTPRSLIIWWKKSENSEPLFARRTRAVVPARRSGVRAKTRTEDKLCSKPGRRFPQVGVHRPFGQPRATRTSRQRGTTGERPSDSVCSLLTFYSLVQSRISNAAACVWRPRPLELS